MPAGSPAVSSPGDDTLVVVGAKDPAQPSLMSATASPTMTVMPPGSRHVSNVRDAR